jgi:3-oxoadipate enol-lactonase
MMTMSDGCAIHYRLDGDDGLPALMFSNSLGATLEMWEPQAEALAGRFRLLRYDNRGHGASDVPAGPYSLERIARDAGELIEGLRLAPVYFCGLSLGGMAGQWLAANAPGLLSRAVLANTSCYICQSKVWDQRIAVVEREGMNAAASGIIQRWLTRDFIDAEPIETARLLAMVAGIPPVGYIAAAKAVRDMDLRPDLARIRIPVLVIAGARDPATPPVMAEAIAGGIAKARLAILDTAHLSNIENPREFNTLLANFLAGA